MPDDEWEKLREQIRRTKGAIPESLLEQIRRVRGVIPQDLLDQLGNRAAPQPGMRDVRTGFPAPPIDPHLQAGHEKLERYFGKGGLREAIVGDGGRTSEKATVSEGSWLPKNWQEARPQIIWGVLVLGCGLELIISILDANFGRAFFALIGLLGFPAMLIHGEQIKQRLLTINPNWLVAAFALFLAGIILSPFVEEKRWPLSAWFPASGTTVVTHDAPTAEDIAKATAPVQAKLDAAQKTIADLKNAAPPAPVVIHDPPTAEEIAKAAGDALRTVTGERDALKEQNNLLRQKVPNSPPPPAPPRPKPTISDLLAESGMLLDIVEKTLVSLEKEWRNTLGGQNPERICLGFSSLAMQDEVSSLAARLRTADQAIFDVLKQNRIDIGELAPLIGYPAQATGDDELQLANAAHYLDAYGSTIKRLGEHPTCEDVIKVDVTRRYSEMTGVLNGFYSWLLQAQEHLSNYRDALRKELRNAP